MLTLLRNKRKALFSDAFTDRDPLSTVNGHLSLLCTTSRKVILRSDVHKYVFLLRLLLRSLNITQYSSVCLQFYLVSINFTS